MNYKIDDDMWMKSKWQHVTKNCILRNEIGQIRHYMLAPVSLITMTSQGSPPTHHLKVWFSSNFC